jgi:hypothetical protein
VGRALERRGRFGSSSRISLNFSCNAQNSSSVRRPAARARRDADQKLAGYPPAGKAGHRSQRQMRDEGFRADGRLPARSWNPSRGTAPLRRHSSRNRAKRQASWARAHRLSRPYRFYSTGMRGERASYASSRQVLKHALVDAADQRSPAIEPGHDEPLEHLGCRLNLCSESSPFSRSPCRPAPSVTPVWNDGPVSR